MSRPGHEHLGVALMMVLDGASLTIDALAAVAKGREEVALAPAARDRIAAAREVVEEALRLNVSVYGLTTALAERKTVALGAANSPTSPPAGRSLRQTLSHLSMRSGRAGSPGRPARLTGHVSIRKTGVQEG